MLQRIKDWFRTFFKLPSKEQKEAALHKHLSEKNAAFQELNKEAFDISGSKDGIIAYSGTPGRPMTSGDSQAPTKEHVDGEHKYNHAKTKEGYGVCRCGTRENTDESLVPCVAPKPKNRRKTRKNKRKKNGNVKKRC